ncbi:hypothetical protein LEMLEM_LOCUS830 [Lemmus lemmus]
MADSKTGIKTRQQPTPEKFGAEGGKEIPSELSPLAMASVLIGNILDRTRDSPDPSLVEGIDRDKPKGSECTGPRRRGGGAGRGSGGGGDDAWPRPLRAPPSRGRPACPRRPLPRASRAGSRTASRRGRRRPGLSDPAAGLPERRGAGGRAQRLELGLDPGPGRSSASGQGGDARRRPGVAERRGIPSHPGAGARSERGGRSGSGSPHDGQGLAALP